MNEAETRAEHIDPALKAAGWGVVDGSRVLREYKIAPLLKLKYYDSIPDAVADLGDVESISKAFRGFQ